MTVKAAGIFILAIPLMAFGQQGPRVRLGIETLVTDSAGMLAGKRIGLVCNHTSVFPDGKHIADSLRRFPGVRLAAVFAPEHGFRGLASAGERVDSSGYADIPVYSLYGKTRKPTSDMLRSIDLLIFDIQDVGARFYTYISTMGLCIEAAAAAGIPVVVCDRPNPIRGDIVEGPVLRIRHRSFVGMYPIPIRHGLTVCELARMAVAKKWLKCPGVDLRCVPMTGWSRSMWFDETGLPWTPPSPNIPTLETAIAYPGMCLIEGSNLSEGRGTEAPFLQTGAPFIGGEDLRNALEEYGIEGAEIREVQFTPEAKPGAAAPKYERRRCGGIRLSIVHRDHFNPIFAGLAVLAAAAETAPDSLQLKPYLAQLAGTDLPPKRSLKRGSIGRLDAKWNKEAAAFRKARTSYLLYR